MPESAPPPLTVVRPGEGHAGALGAITVEFKLMGADTGGALAIVEHGFPPGSLVPPHVHTLEDEYSIVTAGEIGFRSGDREVVLGPRGYITKPFVAASQIHSSVAKVCCMVVVAAGGDGRR